MCTAPRQRLTAVGQSLACSYDIHGCVARAVAPAIRARAAAGHCAIAIWAVAVDADNAAAILHHRRRAAIVAETTGASAVLGGFEIPDCRVRVPSKMGEQK